MKKILSILLIGVIVVSVVGWLCAWIGAMLYNNTIVEDLELAAKPITTWQFFKLELIVDCLMSVALCGIRMGKDSD